ncbi:uncharacterized protein [Watersipora subatra]|uniref:uncharacterized protein n=1 Tax=Watersipora subatra TaxID=2589382 RepID=UPI00355B9719
MSSSDVGDAEAVVAPDSSLLIGGLSLQSWQIVIWVVAAAVFCGVLLALVAAYINYKKSLSRVLPEPTYRKSSLAIQREEILSIVRDIDKASELANDQRRTSTTRQQFLEGKRAGRRKAIGGSSIDAVAGSYRDPNLGSVRSGVTNVSTPNIIDKKTDLFKLDRRHWNSTDSLFVELGDIDTSPDSVRSGVSEIRTPQGSF